MVIVSEARRSSSEWVSFNFITRKFALVFSMTFTLLVHAPTVRPDCAPVVIRGLTPTAKIARIGTIRPRVRKKHQ
jgi:hypothetical protein